LQSAIGDVIALRQAPNDALGWLDGSGLTASRHGFFSLLASLTPEGRVNTYIAQDPVTVERFRAKFKNFAQSNLSEAALTVVA
jgi:hypothetical protein